MATAWCRLSGVERSVGSTRSASASMLCCLLRLPVASVATSVAPVVASFISCHIIYQCLCEFLSWMCDRYCFAPGPEVLTFVCGQPGLYETMCGARLLPGLVPASVLAKLGYAPEAVLKL